MVRTDPITEADLNQYVDGHLPMMRRIEVEAHLSDNPDIAARVMADLRTRDELRLVLADEWRSGRAETDVAALSLKTALRRDRLMKPMRKVAAVACLVAIGWFAHSQFGPIVIREVDASGLPPRYLEDALSAHRTGVVRAAMQSQPEVPSYDSGEIQRATSIAIPELPSAWRVIDAQVFPSRYGPSVEMALDVENLGLVSLFAVRPGVAERIPVTVTQQDGLTMAYWQVDETAYVLSGEVSDRTLDRAAARLAKTLH